MLIMLSSWAKELYHLVNYLQKIEKSLILLLTGKQQGDVFIDNIPQGIIKEWVKETPEQAARLTFVSYMQTPIKQTLEDSETIHAKNRWFTWREIQARPWRCGIIVVGLALAQRVLKPELL